MDNKSKVTPSRRQYNQFVATESMEDYSLRYTPKSFRKWSEFLVANTAIGSISFLALEAIGATIAFNYGFQSAFWGILVASIIIFLFGLPIGYHAAKNNIDIDLLTRAAGFGYLGSTITSLIYASFCFIFFALEAAIMAQALLLYTGMPLAIGYALSSIVILPIVFYGMTAIQKLQQISQPIWLILMLLPFIVILLKEPDLLSQFVSITGSQSNTSEFSLIPFGFAIGISLALIAQIGEQVDYLRFMPDKTDNNKVKWWAAVILAGPGWVILGFLKQIGGILLFALVVLGGASVIEAKEPIHMYNAAYLYVFENPQVALTISFIFVIISQIKINVTNAYAGSLAWSNFFSRVTHTHPGRVIWVIFNISIALLLMELGVFEVLEHILGLYSNVAIAWIAAIVADLVINKPFGLSPPMIEFKRAHLFSINPVGVFSTLIASIIAIVAYSGLFGELAQAFSSIIALVVAFTLAPIIAWLTHGKYYISRQSDDIEIHLHYECGVCGIQYEGNDMASCSHYSCHICSLCCSLEYQCHDQCKTKSEFNLKDKIVQLTLPYLKNKLQTGNLNRLLSFTLVLSSFIILIGVILWISYFVKINDELSGNLNIIQSVYSQIFFILVLLAFIASWLIVLVRENREFVEAELTNKNTALKNSEQTYKQIFEANQAIKLTLDPSRARIIDCNQAALNFYGYSKAEITNLSINDINPMSNEHIKIILNKIINHEVTHFTTQHRLASGEIRDVEIYPSSINTRSGVLIYVILFDITQRIMAEKELQQYELIISQTSDLLLLFDKNYHYQAVNDSYLKAYGIKREDIIGNPMSHILGEDHFNKLFKPKIDRCLNGEELQFNLWVDLPTIKHRYLNYLYVPHRDSNNNNIIIGVIATIRDITAKKIAEDKIHHQANFDSLTDLPNRFLALDRLTQLINEAQRNNEKVALLFLDLDEFKKVNDALGHETGDKLLIEASQRLLKAVRTEDTVGRLGGDEFIILIKGLNNANTVQSVAENIIDSLRKPFMINDRELIVTASIGISIYPDDGDDATQLLRHSDSAMYHAKAQGKNAYSFFTNEMNKEVSRRLALEEQIHSALERDEFYVVYQPKIHTQTNKIIGAEALLRWNNPILGHISPEEFISIAEHTGSIIAMGEFVLKEACQQTAQWQKDFDNNFVIAVNVSPRQFRDSHFIQCVKNIINDTKIKENTLELEITEGVLMSAQNQTNKALNAFNELGINIAMDDFGTGYSSLSYLRKYPFDTLKIDQSFVRDITTDIADKELIIATIAMAHGLNLEVVAEGVETKEQLDALKALSCDFVQGYYFSKPIKANKFEQLLIHGFSK